VLVVITTIDFAAKQSQESGKEPETKQKEVRQGIQNPID
jgi:hypothetical protein